MSPCSRRAHLHAQKGLQEQIHPPGTEGEGCRAHRVYISGETGRPNLPDQDRHCAKPGRGDLPRPAPSPGWCNPHRSAAAAPYLAEGLPNSQSDRASPSAPVRRSVSAPARPPETQPTAQSKKLQRGVRRLDAAATLAPPPRRGRRLAAQRSASSPRAPPSSGRPWRSPRVRRANVANGLQAGDQGETLKRKTFYDTS